MRSCDAKLPMTWEEKSNLHINFHFLDNSVWITFVSLQKEKETYWVFLKPRLASFLFDSVHHPTSCMVNRSSSLPTIETKEANPTTPPLPLPPPHPQPSFQLPNRQKGRTQDQTNAATGEFEFWVSDEKMKWWSFHSEEGLQWQRQ